MFTAILPAGDQAWFFKLVVPGAEADAMRKPFDAFVATINAKPGAKLPTWNLADGWTERPGDEMRAATIVIPYGGKELELTVTTLPYSGEWSAFLEQNVNRWMGQLQQQPLQLNTIEKLARKLPTAGGEATAFELVGKMKASPMGATGMAGMPAGHPPLSDANQPTTSSPPAADDAEQPAGAANDAGSAITYDAPPGWQPGPLVVMGIKREASFKIEAEGGRAEAAVFVFPASGAMADPRANAERWAGMAGLGKLTDDDYRKALSATTLGGLAAERFEMYSPDGATPAKGVLAAMAVRDDMVWSVRLSGDRATVQSQREAFDKFLASIEFPPAG